ncbi:Hypothetical protein A7982_11691 [Minicystis rosea]|nr:Hypothetical protein A7982_11691 [Minicystis rosea]
MRRSQTPGGGGRAPDPPKRAPRAEPARDRATSKRTTPPLSQGGLSFFQRTIGNRAVTRLLAEAGDGALQMKRSTREPSDATPVESPGAPLAGEVRTKMSDAFGVDLSDVRIHEGGAASALGADAFTIGTDIHFAPGCYDATGRRGLALLGHELTHVVQQKAGRAAARGDSVVVNADRALEAEADALGARAAAGERVTVRGASPGGIQCGNDASKQSGGAPRRRRNSVEKQKDDDEEWVKNAPSDFSRHIASTANQRPSSTTPQRDPNQNDAPLDPNQNDAPSEAVTRAAEHTPVVTPAPRDPNQNDAPSKAAPRDETLPPGAVRTMGGVWSIDNSVHQSEPQQHPYEDGISLEERDLIVEGPEQFRTHKSQDKIGVHIDLRFSPCPPVSATSIGLTQTVYNYDKGQHLESHQYHDVIAIGGKGAKPPVPDALKQGEDPAQPGAPPGNDGIHLDKAANNRNPMYAGKAPKSALAKNLVTLGVNPWYGEYGYCYLANGALLTHDATLKDDPFIADRTANAGQVFETTALALDGPQKGTYYGSIRWGWQTDANGNFTVIPLTVVSPGVPTPTFMLAAHIWNKGYVTKDMARPLPLPTSKHENLAALRYLEASFQGEALAARLQELRAKASNDPNVLFEIAYLEHLQAKETEQAEKG